MVAEVAERRTARIAYSFFAPNLKDEMSTETQAVGRARTSPCTVRTDDTLRVRFSATVGEELEIEVALV